MRLVPLLVASALAPGACFKRNGEGGTLRNPSEATTCGLCMGVRNDAGANPYGWCGTDALHGACVPRRADGICRPDSCRDPRWVAAATANECDDPNYRNPPSCAPAAVGATP